MKHRDEKFGAHGNKIIRFTISLQWGTVAKNLGKYPFLHNEPRRQYAEADGDPCPALPFGWCGGSGRLGQCQ